MPGLARRHHFAPELAIAREHGGLHDRELRALGIDPSEIIDFSVNVNPYGPSSAMVRAIRDAPIARYPDPHAFAARRALAEACGVATDEIVLGNGAADLLWTVARLVVRPGGTVAVIEPTFSEFRSAASAIGARVVEWRARAGNGFCVRLDSVAKLIDRARAEVLYACAPNSPTGAAIAAGEIAELAAARPRLTIVLDQSFLSLSDRFAEASVRFPANVFCVRSLTKDHAIPGVRIGYAIVASGVTASIERSRAAWTTSAVAQAAAIAACKESSFVAESRSWLVADKIRLEAALSDVGLEAMPSTAPFLLVRVRKVSGLRRRLLVRHRILVRDCRSFGLPEFIRLGVRPAADVEQLQSALAEELR